MGQRQTGKRAWAPKRDMADRLARDDLAKKFGEDFRKFDKGSIWDQVQRDKKAGLKPGEVRDTYEKRQRYHYRRIKI